MNFHTTGVFFSPTGGTKHALECFLNLFDPNADRLDVTCSPSHAKQVDFGPTDVLVLAFPVYAGQIPAVPELFCNLHGKETPCVLLACYGNRHYDDALAQLSFRLHKQGFICIGAAACITPHIFALSLGKDHPAESDKKVLQNLAQSVWKKLDVADHTPVVLPGEKLPPHKDAKPVPKSRDEKLCTYCKSCVRSCPAQAIDEQLQVDESKCIHCMHCVSICPVGALSYDASALQARLTQNFSARREVELFL